MNLFIGRIGQWAWGLVGCGVGGLALGWILGQLVVVPVLVRQVLRAEGLSGPEWGAVGPSGGYEVVPVG